MVRKALYTSQALLINAHASAGGTGSIALSKEATYVLSIATVSLNHIPFRSTSLTRLDVQEEFIKRMAQAGHRQAAADRRTNVNYEDMCTYPCPSSFYEPRITKIHSVDDPTTLRIQLFARYVFIPYLL